MSLTLPTTRTATSTTDPAPRLTRATDRPLYLWAGEVTFDVVLGGEHTGGAFALLDQRGSRGDTTPMHVHRDEAEVFYVLDGTIAAWAGDDVLEAGAGDALWLPPGLAHAMAITSDTARILTISAPSAFGDFVRQAGVASAGPRPERWAFDVGRIMSAAATHRIDIVGPPPELPVG